ncbi:MAG: polysaccharide deacetylase family protein, partial [Candidatus Thermoplasmatota archaeon]|nr:polysaccharide deacetylase family protein [Candidatus Thermoplasmatota archaeon]
MIGGACLCIRSLSILSLLLLTLVPFSSPIEGKDKMDDLKRDIIEPTAEVCTWKGDLEGALSLTYDDGLNSHIKNASPMMSSRGINGTFFVTTNNVGIPYGGTWSEWQAAADNGHEIGSHTITHPDLTACSPEELREEIVLSKNIIESNLTDVEVDTFSYPMGRYNETVRDLIRDHYIGARTDRHNISGPPEPVPSSPPDLYSVVPVNFGGGNTADELNALVNDTLGSNGWLVEMIHAVGSGGYDPVLLSEFSNHLDLISTKRSVLMVDTFSIILKYIKLRDNAELVSNIVDDVWNLSIDTALDPEVYDVPLTINVTFPSGWIDIEALIRGEQTRFTTNGTEVGSWALVEIGSKEDLCFFRSNIHPSIEQYSPDHGSDLPFSPMNGTSSNVYTFYLNYSSEANRAPMEAPLVHIDIYGDGSQIIVHNMTRVNPLDLDHTDGCIFSWNCTFPPGTCIQIRFSANDTEGLDAVSSSNMTEWMNGPILNDPPLLSGAPLYSGRNGKHPFFNWTPAVDPDGDNISYRLDLNIYTTTLTRYTTNTSFELDWNLHLNNEYWLNLTSIDDRGGVSETLRTHYNLSNEAPPMPDVLNITLNRWGNVDVWFSPVEDPDGDRVRYQLNVYKEEDLLKKPPIRRSYDLRENHVLNISFIERTKYYFFACAIDIFNVEGASTAGIFFHNDAPSPVTGLIVSDLEDNENGLMIQWNASFEEDLDHYTIYRWDEGEGPFDTGSASSERETGTNTTFID